MQTFAVKRCSSPTNLHIYIYKFLPTTNSSWISCCYESRSLQHFVVALMPSALHSQEFTLILPLWSRPPATYCLAYYVQLLEQNAQGGLHLHHHSINRKHWYPGICVAYNEMTLQNTQTFTTHKLCKPSWYGIWNMESPCGLRGGYQLKNDVWPQHPLIGTWWYIW